MNDRYIWVIEALYEQGWYKAPYWDTPFLLSYDNYYEAHKAKNKLCEHLKARGYAWKNNQFRVVKYIPVNKGGKG